MTIVNTPSVVWSTWGVRYVDDAEGDNREVKKTPDSSEENIGVSAEIEEEYW